MPQVVDTNAIVDYRSLQVRHRELLDRSAEDCLEPSKRVAVSVPGQTH